MNFENRLGESHLGIRLIHMCLLAQRAVDRKEDRAQTPRTGRESPVRAAEWAKICWALALRFFNDDQIVELTLDVMKWNYQKVAVALGVDREVVPGELTDLVFDDDGNWVRPA